MYRGRPARPWQAGRARGRRRAGRPRYALGHAFTDMHPPHAGCWKRSCMKQSCWRGSNWRGAFLAGKAVPLKGRKNEGARWRSQKHRGPRSLPGLLCPLSSALSTISTISGRGGPPGRVGGRPSTNKVSFNAVAADLAAHRAARTWRRPPAAGTSGNTGASSRLPLCAN